MISLFHSRRSRRSAFTLVELLVVLAIIALLSALLFPAFKRAQENGNQTTCQSNLHQIYLATQQYYQDERAYPDSIVDLMGEGGRYEYIKTSAPAIDRACTIGEQCDPAITTENKDKGTAYFRGGKDALICTDDDTLATYDTQATPEILPRSSYGALSKIIAPPPPTLRGPSTSVDVNQDAGKYVFNYWGYDPDGFAYVTPVQALAGTPAGSPLLVQPKESDGTTDKPYNQSDFLDPAKRDNLIKYSLSYRFAPPSTILTHCVYHRIQTANDLIAPGQLYYDGNPSNVRDMVLRLDGTVKAEDVSTWKSLGSWQKQTQ